MRLSTEIRLICGLVAIAVSVACGGGMIGPKPISVTVSPTNPSVAEHGTADFQRRCPERSECFRGLMVDSGTARYGQVRIRG